MEKLSRLKALWIPFLLNCLKVLASTLGGVFTGSLALVADGLDSLGNVISSFFTTLFVKKALKPPDEDHPYGHVRFETLSAIITFSYLVSMMVILLHTLMERLGSSGGDLHRESAPFYAAISTLFNFLALFVLQEIELFWSGC
ncbi:MAG TPA: hypothetical protein ENF57_02350 [Candidatus Korarchaeota archaeon]|nr:hypothetical protein [Candidatus Korarchaeota archaeon]